MPPEKKQRDLTDKQLRQSVRALGFRGFRLPLSTTATVVKHPMRPDETTFIFRKGETRKQAVERLREWAWPSVPTSYAKKPEEAKAK